MEPNKFELIGRVNFIDFKALDNGNTLAKILLSRKVKDDVYESYKIVFFGKTSETFVGTCQEGDRVNVSGRMQVDKFTDKNGTNREEIKLIGNDFAKVEYDEKERKYKAVSTKAKAEDTEKSTVGLDYAAYTFNKKRI